MGLFGSRLESSVGSRAIDITLEGHKPVLPEQQRLRLLFLWVVLRKCFLEALGLPSLDDHWKGAKGASVSLLGPADLGGFKGSCNLL